MITIDLLCFECQARYVSTVSREEATYEARHDCPSCGKSNSVGRIPSAPTVLKASWPDGHKGSQDLKEAARLRVLAADMDSLDRQGVAKEISKLEKL